MLQVNRKRLNENGDWDNKLNRTAARWQTRPPRILLQDNVRFSLRGFQVNIHVFFNSGRSLVYNTEADSVEQSNSVSRVTPGAGPNTGSRTIYRVYLTLLTLRKAWKVMQNITSYCMLLHTGHNTIVVIQGVLIKQEQLLPLNWLDAHVLQCWLYYLQPINWTHEQLLIAPPEPSNSQSMPVRLQACDLTSKTRLWHNCDVTPRKFLQRLLGNNSEYIMKVHTGSCEQ